MLIRYITLIAFIITISVVLSCSGTTPASEQSPSPASEQSPSPASEQSPSPASEQSFLDRNWGRSLETIRYMQMVDPEAGKNLDPVVGLDGNASVNNVDKYQNSFKETEQKESATILKLQ